MSVPYEATTDGTDSQWTPVPPRPVNRLAIIRKEIAYTRKSLYDLNQRILADVPGIDWGEGNRLPRLNESFSIEYLGDGIKLRAFLSEVYWIYRECLADMPSNNRTAWGISKLVYGPRFFHDASPSQQTMISEWRQRNFSS